MDYNGITYKVDIAQHQIQQQHKLNTKYLDIMQLY